MYILYYFFVFIAIEIAYFFLLTLALNQYTIILYTNKANGGKKSMSKKKDVKEKNELDELLQTIKKSLNNKTSLSEDDMSTALQVIEINKLKKELVDTLEKMCALKYVQKEKIKTALNNTLNSLKRELNPLLNSEQTEKDKRKKEREDNKKKSEKTENVNEAQETQNQ